MKKISLKNKTVYIIGLFLAAVFYACPALSDVPPGQKPEVEFLIETVRTTDCKFDRNGKTYSGKKAASHLQRKYNHYKDEITSTETFIEYSATKSMLSGADYYIICPGEPPVRSQDWLLEKLSEFRQKNKTE
ncbi:MAG TPA: DUF5329 family protein [Thermodesulfobacteriota bacterium]|nr:DUF5329 family protein [Thermodesulfobacteriota bacterium]